MKCIAFAYFERLPCVEAVPVVHQKRERRCSLRRIATRLQSSPETESNEDDAPRSMRLFQHCSASDELLALEFIFKKKSFQPGSR